VERRSRVRRQYSLPTCGFCVLLLVGAGCRPKLPVDPDGILYYFRNARVQGEVRRVWPEGQHYVDSVLRADAQLMKELNALLAWQRPDSLWLRDDPRWQDTAALGDTLETLRGLVAKSASRQERLETLRSRISAVPPELPAERQAGFVEEVWQALALTGPGLGKDVRAALPELEQGVQEFVALFETAMAEAKGATSQPTTDATDIHSGPGFDERYQALHARLLAWEEELLRQAEQRLTLARPPADEERARRHFTYERAYWRKTLESYVKAVAAARDEAQAELGQVEKQLTGKAPLNAVQRTALEALREWLRARVSAREQRWAALKGRVDEILQKSKAAAG
jgi:hypothetical protein